MSKDKKPAKETPVAPEAQKPSANAAMAILGNTVPQLFGLVQNFQGCFSGVGAKVREQHRRAGMEKLNFIYGMITALGTVLKVQSESEAMKKLADTTVKLQNTAQVLWNVIEQHHDGKVIVDQMEGLADHEPMNTRLTVLPDGKISITTRGPQVERVDEGPEAPTAGADEKGRVRAGGKRGRSGKVLGDRKGETKPSA